LFEGLADPFIRLSTVGQMVPFENPARVRVDDEDWVTTCVEENRIRCLWAYAMDFKQLRAQEIRPCAKHPDKGSSIDLVEEVNESFQLARFLAKVSRRTNQLRQLGFLDASKRRGIQQLFMAQAGQCPLDVAPTGVLREDRPNNDLKAGTGRPPMLRSMSLEQGLVVFLQNRQGREVGFAMAIPRSTGFRSGLLPGSRQISGCRHLLRKIATHPQQVKNSPLSFDAGACSPVQVLANSERGGKFWRRVFRPFAIVSLGCTCP